VAINPTIEKNKIIANKTFLLKKLDKICHQYLVAFNCHSSWLWLPNLVIKNLGTQFFEQCLKNFNHLPKIFNHLMDHGLISTIDLVIEFYFFAQKHFGHY
jgi:hypothetical protein